MNVPADNPGMCDDEAAAVRRTLNLARSLFSGPELTASIQRWRPRIAPFHRLLPLVPSGASVLEVGCGAGLFLGMLALEGKLGRGIGFDANQRAIALARRMVSGLAPSVASSLTFLRSDVGDPWPKGNFDVVAMIDVMHHIPAKQQQAVLRAAFDKTAPGGAFLYKGMAERPLYCALANRLHDLIMARQWIHYLPVSQAERWLEAAGARVEVTGACQMVWYQHDYRLFRRPGPTSLEVSAKPFPESDP